jgi:hypothetical protein
MSLAKKNVLPPEDSAAAQESGFPVPFSIEEFRKNILTFFLTQVRTIGWMTDVATAWGITGKSDLGVSELFNPDLTAEELGLTYADVSETTFARCMECLYQFAYYGILDESIESMSYESIYTWLTAIIDDTARGRVAAEWDSYGAFGVIDIANLYRVAETANARRILEGMEHFYYFYSKDGDQTDDDALSVRQMALLAGMEEMSIRAAANPNRVTPLPKQDTPGHTRFAVEDAKNWLQAKGRYVPVTRRWTRMEIDFSTRRFSSFEDVLSITNNRLADLDRENGRNGDVYFAFQALFPKHGISPDDPRANFLAPAFVRDLAEVLRFPADLFCLRVRELFAKEESAAIKHALRELTIDPAE